MCCGAAGQLLLLVSKTEIKKHQMMGSRWQICQTERTHSDGHEPYFLVKFP